MKKLLLGAAFLGLTIVACQNPSKNTVEAGGAPEVCPMTGQACEMDKEACDDMGACPMGGECDMDAGCDMEGMKADCDGGGCDMQGKDMGECPMGGMEKECDMDAMGAKSDCCSGKE